MNSLPRIFLSAAVLLSAFTVLRTSAATEEPKAGVPIFCSRIAASKEQERDLTEEEYQQREEADAWKAENDP